MQSRSLPNGRQSSWTKDLVDLVVVARTFHVDGTLLTIAIDGEARRRHIEPLTAFSVPLEAWKVRYSRMAAQVPACEGHTDVEAAEALIAKFVNPCLEAVAVGKTWRPQELVWVET